MKDCEHMAATAVLLPPFQVLSNGAKTKYEDQWEHMLGLCFISIGIFLGICTSHVSLCILGVARQVY